MSDINRFEDDGGLVPFDKGGKLPPATRRYFQERIDRGDTLIPGIASDGTQLGPPIRRDIHPDLDPQRVQDAARVLLSNAAGLDVTTPHGRETPKRFVQMLKELTTPEEFNFTTFPADYDEMIIVRNLPFVSLCNHHVVPFHGVAHIGYVPNELMAGLSKFGRTVKYFAKRLQVQEELTNDIATYLQDMLSPKGVIVMMEAEHLCMTIRGVQMPGAMTRTTCVKGVFADHDRTAKMEFLSAINGGH